MATDSGQQDDGSAAVRYFYNDLPKYAAQGSCVKCGCALFKIRFVEREVSGGPTKLIWCEHMLITCASCGYQWRERTKDAKAEQ